MNTALRNPFMLQEGSSSLPPLRLPREEEAKESKKNGRRKGREREREKERERETLHLAGIFPCNSRCYILFVYS